MTFRQTLKTFGLLVLLGIWGNILSAQTCCDNCPLPLPDGANEDFSIFVMDEGVNPDTDCTTPLESIRLHFDHEYLGDLQITITSPCGNSAILVAPVDFLGDTDFSAWDVTFQDGATTWNNADFPGMSQTWTGTFSPFSGTIAGLNCPNNCGEWTLNVLDGQGLDAGNFFDFNLNFADSNGPDDLGCNNTGFPSVCNIVVENIGGAGYNECENINNIIVAAGLMPPFPLNIDPCTYCSFVYENADYGPQPPGCFPGFNSEKTFYFVYGTGEEFDPCSGEGELITDLNNDGLISISDFAFFYNGDGCAPVYITWVQKINVNEPGCPCDNTCAVGNSVEARIFPPGYVGNIEVFVEGDCNNPPRVEIYPNINGVMGDVPCEIEYFSDYPGSACGQNGLAIIQARVLDSDLNALSPLTDVCYDAYTVPYSCDCCVYEVEANASDEVCLNENNGTVTISVQNNAYNLELEYALIPGGGPYDGTNAGPFQIDPVFNDLSPNVYSVVVRDVVDQLCAITSGDVEVDPGISPTVKTIENSAAGCPGIESTYIVVGAVAGNTYDWFVDPGLGMIISGNGTPEAVLLISDELPLGVGPYNITVIETDINDCTQTYSKAVFVEVDAVLICNDNLNISLNENCELLFTVDWALEEQLYPDYSYEITVFDENGNVVPDGLVNIKGNYSYSISHLCSGNSCWGNFVAEDKIIPVLECPDEPSIDLVCPDINEIFTPEITVIEDNINEANFLTILATGNPVGQDNCGMYSISFSDELLIEDDCNDNVILRTFFIEDMAGNQGEPCTQEIHIRKPSLDDVVLPDEIIVECGAQELLSAAALNEAGFDNAFPLVNSFFGTHFINESYCNLGASYTDSPNIPVCGGSFKIIRSWSVLDWCSGETILHNQLIKILDTTAPEITCPSYESVTAANSAGNCNALVTILPLDALVETCSGPVSVTVEVAGANGNIYAPGDELLLPAGIHTLVYTATDVCANSVICDAEVTIIDDAPPVAICDEHTIAALGADGSVTICWQTFDDGSYDNCGEPVVRVKRSDASSSEPFSECVEFDCSDIGDVVMVRMRVWDVLPANGFPDNDNGRWNECVVEVSVQDKLAPEIVCPPDKTVECQSDITELDGLTDDASYPPVYYNGNLVGYYAGANDNCHATVSVAESGSLDNCGEGRIFRRWTVEDDGARTDRCTQRITFENSAPFTAGDIDWPEDYTANCTDDSGTDPDQLPAGFNLPEITEDACDLVAVTYEDTFLQVTEGACWKIIRKWIVIDWCRFGVNGDNSYDGYWEYTQVIKVQDTVEPVILSACENIEVCNYQENCRPTFVELILDAEDYCSADLNFSYVIDAFNDGEPDGNAFAGNINDASGNYPNGTHLISWTVEDGCGNISNCSYRFTVEDCKKPTPICINGLATVVMPAAGNITLWDTDFNAPGTSGSFDNCTAQEDLRYRIRKLTGNDEPVGSLNQVLNLDKNTVFDCDDLGFVNVELYVIDGKGNWGFCTTYVSIQDNEGVCLAGELAAINGSVETEYQEMIGDVLVNAISVNPVPPFLTQTDGTFDFSNLPMGSNVTIVPEKDMDYLNGVTTFDLVIISKHILGTAPLDSPYKIIAADANRSNSVTTLDLVLLRRLILNIDTTLDGNTSWRFVDQDFVFPNPANPFATAFPEQVSINELNADLRAEFTGVKIGDVNGSAIPNNLLSIEGRNFSGKQIFEIEDKKVIAGESFAVQFKAKDFNAISGYQFALGYDTDMLVFDGIEPAKLAGLGPDNFGLTMLDEGLISTSWHQAKAVTVKDGNVLFEVRFKALQNTTLSNGISLNSAILSAEAYTSGAETKNVALAFSGKSGGIAQNDAFALYQNQPNPFGDATNITFDLPEAGPVILTIFDVSGKVIKVIRGKFGKGRESIKIHRDDLPASGILYYQLETGMNQAVRKMILLE